MSLDVYLTVGEEQVFEANITHNLGAMAREAGIYTYLWRPEELDITKAGELVEPLRTGMAAMCAEPSKFEALNASNGWGTYEQFLPWIAKYFEACAANPDATVRASR